jgi:hypothetical protein
MVQGQDQNNGTLGGRLGFGTCPLVRCAKTRNEFLGMQRIVSQATFRLWHSTCAVHVSVAVIHNLLVALDDRDASMRAVEYVGAFLAGRNDFKIHLLHALKPCRRN